MFIETSMMKVMFISFIESTNFRSDDLQFVKFVSIGFKVADFKVIDLAFMYFGFAKHFTVGYFSNLQTNLPLIKCFIFMLDSYPNLLAVIFIAFKSCYTLFIGCLSSTLIIVKFVLAIIYFFQKINDLVSY